MPCPFCSLSRPALNSNENAIVIFDQYPVSKFHCLVIPRRHLTDISQIDAKTMADIMELVQYVCTHIRSNDSSVSGFNIGVNNGRSAGQSVEHMHFHVIPRRTKDSARPMGGLRKVINGEGEYAGACQTP